MNGRAGARTAVARPGFVLLLFALGTLAAIAILQLSTAPALVTALIAPDLGAYLSAPLSGPVIAQIFFMPSIAAISLALILYLLHQPSADPRLRLLLLNFVAVTFVLLAILRLAPAHITTEESKLAHFTGAVLFFTAACAAANAFLARNTTRFLLWVAGALAFAFAAFDEILEIHEKVGIALKARFGGTTKAAEQATAPAFQDFVTLAYSVTGLLVLVGLYIVFRKQVRGRTWFILTFVFAALIYFLSTVLDSFDFLLSSLSRTVDLLYLASVLEEILEFVAASLFFVAFAIAFLDGGGRALLDDLKKDVGPRFPRPRAVLWTARGVAYAATAVFVAAIIALSLEYSARAALLTENSDYSVRLFANSADNNLLHPDGMTYANGHLYVANDVPPSVMTIKAGKSRILTAADELKRPESIAVAKDGTVYLTDDTRRLLLRIRPGLAPETILGPDKLKEPKGLAFDSTGALYVVDFGASAILVLRDNKVETIASVPRHRPEEIAFDRFGNLYFTEESPARVMKISPSGALSTFVDGASGVVAIEDIAIAGDDIYVADSRRGAIFKFGLNGEGRVVLAFEKRTGVEIEAITLDDDGVIYLGFRKPERKFLGMRRVDFIMCIADPPRAKAAC